MIYTLLALIAGVVLGRMLRSKSEADHRERSYQLGVAAGRSIQRTVSEAVSLRNSAAAEMNAHARGFEKGKAFQRNRALAKRLEALCN